MNRISIILTILLTGFILTALAGALPYGIETSSDNGAREWTTWTKAICSEENYCIDILITCDGNRVVDLKPLSEGIYFSSGWEDKRPLDLKNQYC